MRSFPSSVFLVDLSSTKTKNKTETESESVLLLFALLAAHNITALAIGQTQLVTLSELVGNSPDSGFWIPYSGFRIPDSYSDIRINVCMIDFIRVVS